LIHDGIIILCDVMVIMKNVTDEGAALIFSLVRSLRS